MVYTPSKTAASFDDSRPPIDSLPTRRSTRLEPSNAQGISRWLHAKWLVIVIKLLYYIFVTRGLQLVSILVRASRHKTFRTSYARIPARIH